MAQQSERIFSRYGVQATDEDMEANSHDIGYGTATPPPTLQPHASTQGSKPAVREFATYVELIRLYAVYSCFLGSVCALIKVFGLIRKCLVQLDHAYRVEWLSAPMP